MGKGFHALGDPRENLTLMEKQVKHDPIAAKTKLTRAQVIARSQERLAQARAQRGTEALADLLRPSLEEVHEMYNKLRDTDKPSTRPV